MAYIPFKYCAQCVIAFAVMSAALHCVFYIAKLSTTRVETQSHKMSHLTESPRKLLTEWTSVSVSNVVLPVSFDFGNETFDCRIATLMKMSFPVCHYTVQTDRLVTKMLLRGMYMESYEVSRFVLLLHGDPQLQFVDIGANVGLFTLPAARVTKVLAVEPNRRSISRLAKAVVLGRVTSNVTLVHNAISNVRTTLYMGVDPTNQGNAYLINTANCTDTILRKPCNTLLPTRTILLNDLLPLMRSKAALLKVDVEGNEFRVFTESTARQFFDHVDVRLVLMEWAFHRRNSVNTIQPLLNFFYSRNYTVFNTRNKKLKENYRRWPGNIVFKKFAHMPF